MQSRALLQLVPPTLDPRGFPCKKKKNRHKMYTWRSHTDFPWVPSSWSEADLFHVQLVDRVRKSRLSTWFCPFLIVPSWSQHGYDQLEALKPEAELTVDLVIYLTNNFKNGASLSKPRMHWRNYWALCSTLVLHLSESMVLQYLHLYLTSLPQKPRPLMYGYNSRPYLYIVLGQD